MVLRWIERSLMRRFFIDYKTQIACGPVFSQILSMATSRCDVLLHAHICSSLTCIWWLWIEFFKMTIYRTIVSGVITTDSLNETLVEWRRESAADSSFFRLNVLSNLLFALSRSLENVCSPLSFFCSCQVFSSLSSFVLLSSLTYLVFVFIYFLNLVFLCCN